MSDKQWHGHYPEPLQEAPEVGVEVWAADAYFEDFLMPYEWSGDECNFRLLKRGRLHLTSEAAKTQAIWEIEQAGGVV